MLTDIVERLREGDATNYGGDLQALLDDAADEIERLRGKIDASKRKLRHSAISSAKYINKSVLLKGISS